MVENNLESRLKGTDERTFIEKLLDGAGAAVGTSLTTRSLIIGAPGYAVLAYLASYGGFKIVKYVWNVIRHPIKNLSLNGLGEVIYDAFANILPYRDRVPAGVGVISAGVNYAGGNLASYLN